MISQRTPDEISGDIASRLPEGWAWDRAPTSATRRSFKPLEAKRGGLRARGHRPAR